MCHAVTSGLSMSELGLAAAHVRTVLISCRQGHFVRCSLQGHRLEVPKGPLREQSRFWTGTEPWGTSSLTLLGSLEKTCAGSLLKTGGGVEEGALGPLLGVGGCGVCCRNRGRRPSPWASSSTSRTKLMTSASPRWPGLVSQAVTLSSGQHTRAPRFLKICRSSVPVTKGRTWDSARLQGKILPVT